MIRTTTTCLLAVFGVAVVAAAQERSADVQQPPIQARPGGPESAPRTDQTVDVVKGTRLVLSNNAGEVTVRSWDRDQVRIQATHAERDRVDVQTADNTLRVRARSTRGPASLADFQITVPRWMPVNLSGTYLEATIEGTTAEVTAESVHGNIRVAGGSGAIVARSVEGLITIEKASGKVQATGVNEGIRLIDVSGDMSAETTNGDIAIDNAQTTSLEASTVNGDVTFNGTMRDGGAYRLTTHGGDIRIGLGGAPNATVFVRTFNGDFSADFPIQLPEGQSAREGSKRFNFTLGSGSARIELQSFNGDIQVARKTIVSEEEARRMRRGQTPKPPQPPSPSRPPVPPVPPRVPPIPDFGLTVDGRFEHLFDHEFEHEAEFELEHDRLQPTIDADLNLDFSISPSSPIAPLPAPSPSPVPRPRP